MACYLWGVRPGTKVRFIWGLLTPPDLTVCVLVCVYCAREPDLMSLYTVYSVFGLPGNYESVMVSYEARLLCRIWTKFGLDWLMLGLIWKRLFFIFFVFLTKQATSVWNLCMYKHTHLESFLLSRITEKIWTDKTWNMNIIHDKLPHPAEETWPPFSLISKPSPASLKELL